MKTEKYAVALNRQSKFAPTEVGEFVFVPEYDRHLWKSKTASNMAELAEQVNGAINSVINFGDPFQTLEVVQVEKPDTKSASNGNKLAVPQRKLKVIGKETCQVNEEVLA